ncbi:MAG: DHH family phosphoesterase [Chloroflexota bacterium]
MADESVALAGLREAIGSSTHVLILPHNDPDPDAIASAVALKFLLVELWGVTAEIRYNGIIGRAENQALVTYLGDELEPMQMQRVTAPVILVDTQPGAGNNPLPEGTTVEAVIDHHPLLPQTPRAAFADVRPDVGACATILTEYLLAADLTPPTTLATGLFYGIKSDTMALGRNVAESDVEAYVYLQALTDPDALIEIEQAQVPPAYFQSINTTLEAARVYEDVLIADVGVMAYPDLVAELADWLLRLQGVDWVVCMGVYRNSLRLAVRTRHHEGGAGHMVQKIVAADGIAGGHGTMAGGQVALNGLAASTVSARLRRRILSYFGIPATAGRRLMTITGEEGALT